MNKKSPSKQKSQEDEDEDTRLFLSAINKIDTKKISNHKEFKEDHVSPKAIKKKSKQVESIDLHGMSILDAEHAVERFLREVLKTLIEPTKVRIITGKGLHSRQGGPLLASEIHHYIKNRFSKNINQIDEAPTEVKIGGVPIRGHFDIILKKG